MDPVLSSFHYFYIQPRILPSRVEALEAVRTLVEKKVIPIDYLDTRWLHCKSYYDLHKYTFQYVTYLIAVFIC